MNSMRNKTNFILKKENTFKENDQRFQAQSTVKKTLINI